jgi:DNA-binding response OmpR family regulator
MASSDANRPLVLIVEDDASIRRGLELNLQGDGYRTIAVPTGELALEVAQRENVAVMLLDIMLPGMSGLEVCRTARARGCLWPIILVSARGSETDVVRGLAEGADDYVVKPFRINELLARVRVRLRRQPATDIVRFGDVVIDLDRHEVTRAGQAVELSPTEFDLLRLLVRRQGDVLTRDAILRSVWGDGYDGTDRTVDNFINRLRSKLDDRVRPNYFHTIRGVGYRFEPPRLDSGRKENT